VAVALPIHRLTNRYLEVTGTTVAVNSSDLVARVPGFIRSINYADGAFVRAGTLLFTIEPDVYDVKLKQAKDAEFGAEASLTQMQRTYERFAQLDRLNAIAKTLVDQALGNRDNAKSTLLQAQANVRLAQLNSDYAHVRAPYDGVVTARQVSIGEYVGGAATPTVLATIVQIDPIYVNFNVSENDALRIKASPDRPKLTQDSLKNIPVNVGLQTETGYPHVGALNYISPTFSPSTGTLAARGVLKNADRALLPGVFVRVRVPAERPQMALLVPDAALGSDQGGRYLLVVGPNNMAEQRSVSIGQLTDGLRVIESGLGATDRVVVTGLMRAAPGEQVDPQMRVADAADSKGR
jgi:RND family efflux transporter MFP subunit